MRPSVIAIAVGYAACASTPPPDPTEIGPGIYLLMRGTERDLMDIEKVSKAMLRAGDFCARTNQKPEIILGDEAGQHQMSFRCGEAGTWPPKPD